jgi:hypothetical protein
MEPGRPGQKVRWKRRGRWRYGHLGDPPVEADGGLRVYDDDFNGAARTLRRSEVERLERGPRGGRRWLPCDPAGWRVVITQYQRAGSEELGGRGRPVEVFRQLGGPVARLPDEATDARAGAVARASRDAAATERLRGHRVDLVRVTMLCDDTEIWLARTPEGRWEPRADLRVNEAGGSPFVLDGAGWPDPLALRKVLRGLPAGRHRDVAVVAL